MIIQRNFPYNAQKPTRSQSVKLNSLQSARRRTSQLVGNWTAFCEQERSHVTKVHKKTLASRMRPVSTLLAVFWMGVCSAWGQEGNSADDVRKGHHLATMLCTTCHVVAPDQSYEPTLSPPGPSFESIAQRKDISAELLQKFLTTTHQGLDTPKGMPDPNLADFQVKEIVAYLLSLRK